MASSFSPPTLSRAPFLVAGLVLATAAMALGQKPPQPAPAPYNPPALTFPDNRITLIEAVRLTLEQNPTIKLSFEQNRTQQGLAQAETGRFDTLITGNLSGSLLQSALTRSEVLAEQKRRNDIQKLINGCPVFGPADPDKCHKEGLETTRDDAQNRVNQYRAMQTEFSQTETCPTAARLTDTGEQSQFDIINAQIRANAGSPEVLAAYKNLCKQLIDQGITTYQKVFDQSVAELITERQRLANLGDIPRENQKINGKIDLNLVTPARNGVTPGLFFTGSFESDRFKGKPNLEDFGGKGIEDLYSYSVGFTVDASLLRGRGVDATGAPEQAALIDYEASKLTLKHTASVSVLNSVAAYWNLVAAQERLEIARQSAELQRKRVEITDALISADELPRAERARVLASQASDQGLVYASERAVNEARVALARAIGLSVLDEKNSPLAADPFPPAPDAAELRAMGPSELIRIAVERRYDRQAAVRLIASGGILLRAAETDLRPLLNFHGQVSGGTIAERRLANTSHGWSAPSFSLAFDFEKPIGNNAARGRLLQRDAQLQQRSIAATDLDRNIRADVVQTLRSLQETADQVKKAKESVEFYGKTITSENERFRLGESSLIDTILTQQLQTNALFAYADAKQQYATLLAQLRFETGTLVREEPSRSVVNRDDLVTLPSAPK